MLAVALASFGAAGSQVAYTVVIGGIAFASFMILVMPRVLGPLARRFERDVAAGTPQGMLVLMAIVTTLMASPVFEIVYGRAARKSGELGAVESAG